MYFLGLRPGSFSLSKEETLRFSGLLIAGPACDLY